MEPRTRLLPGVTLVGPGRWVGTDEAPELRPVDAVAAALPRFRRDPFGANRHLDVVVREAADGEPEVPVAVVSKKYVLVPHADVLDAVVGAFESKGLGVDTLRARLELTEYGERMSLSVQLPAAYGFDPGDGHPVVLQVSALNSVDGLSRLTILLGWYRVVCANGLLVGTARERMARAHTGSLEPKAIRRLLERGMRVAEAERSDLRLWLQTPVSPDALRDWADGPLCRRWGVGAAARVYHVAVSGNDVGFVPPLQKRPPSERAVRAKAHVPGASAPARDAWAVAQALSWVASRLPEPAARIARQREVPSLVAELQRQAAPHGAARQEPLFG